MFTSFTLNKKSINSKHKFGTFVLIFLLLLLFSPIKAKSSDSENKLQAVYIYNFLKFVYWTDKSLLDVEDKFKICIIGEHSFGSLLDSWKYKHIKNKKIDLFYYESVASVIDKKCHMVFVGKIKEEEDFKLLILLRKKGLLTISANKNFAKQGGIISFVRKKNKVRFHINLTSAKQNNLIIGSDLLELATTIY